MVNYWQTEKSVADGIPSFLYHFFGEGVGDWRFINSSIPLLLSPDNVTYSPWPCRHDSISVSMTEDRRDLNITIAAGSGMDVIYTGYPPAAPLNVIIRRTHNFGEADRSECPVVWQGQVIGIEFNEASEVEMVAQPRNATTSRPGLRRNYQIGCPHLLYGPDCRASRSAASTDVVVASVTADGFTLQNPVNPANYRGGMVAYGARTASILSISSSDEKTVSIGGGMLGIKAGDTVTLTYGCDHSMSDCLNLHHNINNFGGCPFIPMENPSTSSSSIFY